MNETFGHAALAIAAALFDSYWEGALIVGAVWLGLRCLPALGAATRYAVWLCTLAALVVTPIFTVALPQHSSETVTDAAMRGTRSRLSLPLCCRESRRAWRRSRWA